jgi:hypothetical protein
MAIRPVKLHHRIKAQPGYQAAPSGPVTGQHPDPGMTAGITSGPLSLVTVQPVDNNYVTLGMQEYQPIYTADGAIIASTGPGRWDQLRQAGKS